MKGWLACMWVIDGFLRRIGAAGNAVGCHECGVRGGCERAPARLVENRRESERHCGVATSRLVMRCRS
jgi:hypothetical protein